jgi:magnesium-transporting ATPase (P-type)
MFKEFAVVLGKSRLAKIGLVLAIIGLVAFIIGLLSPLNKGVPMSAGRIVLDYIFNIFYAGLIIMLWAYFKDHKTWLVPWYQEGQKIELFSSQRIVRIALIAAATVVFAFVKIPFLGWSIRTVAPAFGAMFFGLLEGLVGGWVGYILSTLIVGGYTDPLATMPLWMSTDAVIIALFSVLYFRYIRDEPSAGKRSKLYFLMLLVSFVIWYVLIVSESIGSQGAAVVLPLAFQYLMGGLIVLAVITLIAVGAVEAMNRTRWAKAARSHQKK